MVVGVLSHVTRASTEVLFHPDLFFKSRCVSRFNHEKSREICIFWSHKHISNFSVYKKINVHYSVYMRTSGEKVRISDEAERVQSVSYSDIRSLPGLYTVVCLKRRQARHLPRASLCNFNVQSTLLSKGTNPVPIFVSLTHIRKKQKCS